MKFEFLPAGLKSSESSIEIKNNIQENKEGKKNFKKFFEILSGIQTGAKELFSWGRTDMDDDQIQLYARRFLISTMTIWTTLHAGQIATEAVDRVNYEIQKNKYEKKQNLNPSLNFESLYKEAIEVFGENYINSLPGIKIETGRIKEEVSEQAELEKPDVLEIFRASKSLFDFDLEDWKEKFQEYEDKLGNVVKATDINLEQSSEHLIFEKDTALNVFSNETYAEYKRRMDNASLDTVDMEEYVTKLNKFFPEGWIRKEVRTISFKNEPLKIEHNGSDFFAAGLANKKDIFLFGIKPESNTSQVFAHESGHTNDWEESSVFTPTERLEFLMNVYKRVNSDDRYHSLYVESILDGTLYPEMDQTTIKKTATVEYWAEIAGAYFSYGPSNLDYKDVEIIESVIKKVDPDFLKKNSVGGTYIMSKEDYKSIYFKLKEKVEADDVIDENESTKLDFYSMYNYEHIMSKYDQAHKHD